MAPLILGMLIGVAALLIALNSMRTLRLGKAVPRDAVAGERYPAAFMAHIGI